MTPGAPGAGPPWTGDALLAALRAAGAPRLERVCFRRNRRVIWSVTSGGRTLNLHEGYRTAPWSCVRHFAALARGAYGSHPAAHEARAAVGAWEGLGPAVAKIRRGVEGPGRRRDARSVRPSPCCGTPEQIAWLRRVYRELNLRRFGGALPADLHLRLSSRMRSRLGHMRGHVREGRRYVVEIALSVDLMLEGNRTSRIDILLHEMAHAADWLENGGRGHGATWRSWARRAGCEARACTRRPVVRRRRGAEPVRRVPSMPDGSELGPV